MWDAVKVLRDQLETRLADAAPDAIFVGQNAKRLPNTSCIAVPGWKGETQVMQMDLEGIAVSAGSACSSGKVRSSDVLKAIGLSESDASCAIRISLGLDTTEEDVERFAKTWIKKYENNLKRKNYI